MFHFLTGALQVTPNMLLQALMGGDVTQTALHAAAVVSAVETAARTSGAVPHLPSQWKVFARPESLWPTREVRRFAPIELWIEPRSFAENRLAAGEGGDLLAAPRPQKTWADFLRNFLEEAILNETPCREVRSRLAATFPNPIVVLLTGVGDRLGEIEPFQILRLSQVLGIDGEEAAEIAGLWQECHGVKPILAPGEWNQNRRELCRLFSLRLHESAAKAGSAWNPRRLQKILHGAPAVVVGAFHNVVFGTDRDLPCESRSALARRLFGEAALKEDKTEPVDYWEKFWEGEAAAFGWKKKPVFRHDPFGVFSAMAYAALAEWPLKSLERQLERIVSQHPETAYILTSFHEIFRPAGAKDLRPRRSLDEILKLNGEPETRRRKYFTWMDRWEKYARERKRPDWLRPLPEKIRGRKVQDSDKSKMEKIFRDAAGKPNTAIRIHRRLLAAKMFDEAAMLANLAAVLEGVRLPTARLPLEGNFTGAPATLESNVLALMEELRLAVKPKEASPSRKAHSTKLGRRFRELEAIARGAQWDVARLLQAIREDDQVGALLEERSEAFRELLAARLRFETDGGSRAEVNTAIRRVAGDYRVDKEVVRAWWERATLWFDEFS